MFHYLFAVPSEVRSDPQTLMVRTAENATLSVRTCFVYLTHMNGVHRQLSENGPYATTRLLEAAQARGFPAAGCVPCCLGGSE